MPVAHLQDIALPVLGGLIGGLFALRAATAPRMQKAGDAFEPGATFLFRDSILVDASPGACMLVGAPPEAITPQTLAGALEPRFPGLAKVLSDPEGGVLTAALGDSTAHVTPFRDSLRISITDASDCAAKPAVGNGLVRRELEEARTIARLSAVPIWQVGGDGRIHWANAAYLDLVRRQTGLPDPVWPLPHLFGRPDDPNPTGQDSRVCVAFNDDVLWFRVHAATSDAGTVLTAWPDDAAVQAQEHLSAFKLALSNTFAQLSVGIAIFDARKRLVLFNPALTDLTGMDARHLVALPSLNEFLDRLREIKMLPEPRNYHDWKARLNDLDGASGQTLSETWPLGDGRTLRVRAQPHDNGSVAFLFEDISSEIGLTRSFRAELDLSYAVLDSLDDAIAVFTASGHLASANRAFTELWGDPALESLATETTLRDACAIWQAACVPSPVWADSDGFAARLAGRDHWSFDITTRAGQGLRCIVQPLTGGALCVRFGDRPVTPTAMSDRPQKIPA
ncbi:PAS-domain containing protein [Anianabacter salinae]|uniref:PAS-domain containing protein n=1 Tax=Anianabacter salinae TaxID=2851023 RepID=UPI00225E173B|nr:PAS-domain containing protein [Anianabacter salinae]MBV0913492.1 PAS domain-containing protein [Anianabacter salinae]